MSLSRISGKEDLYVGGIFSLKRRAALESANITHILSMIKYDLDKESSGNLGGGKYQHLSIDLDDMDDEDMLVHFPRAVRFIESGLYLPSADDNGADAQPSGAVLVHCAMGKSRSVAAVVAYLLWKHPTRFGGAAPGTPGAEAVGRALEWVREARALAEPNPGFLAQLALWWEMGRPAEGEDAVRRHPVYQRWAYRREVEESARVGRAPERIRFEDEVGGGGVGERGKGAAGLEVRCKKCRRVLATKPFVVAHAPPAEGEACPHVFIEPLSWMRAVLEEGALEGRLICPSARCGASVGRYAWQGFKCSCHEWVCPAFSLQRSRVDEVVVRAEGSGGGGGASDLRAVLNIRMPPAAAGPAKKENL